MSCPSPNRSTLGFRARAYVVSTSIPRRTLTLVPRNEDSGLTKQGAVVSACEKEFRELGEAEV